MLRPKALQGLARNAGVLSYTVTQASAITDVPAKAINTYLDRELQFLATIGAGFRAVCKDGLLAVRLNFECIDSLLLDARLQVIQQAMTGTRNKYVTVSGQQVIVRVDLARSVVQAGLSRFRAAQANITTSEDVLSGEPCIKGTRLSAYLIRDLYEECGRDEVLETYPGLSDVQIDAARMYALAFPRRGRPRSVESRLTKAEPTRSRVVRVKP